jgi:hypothetical protein
MNWSSEDLKPYLLLRDQGKSPKEVDRLAEAKGVSRMGRIGLLVKVFGLSLIEAKAISMTEEGSLDALSRQQATLIEPLNLVLEEFERESDS